MSFKINDFKKTSRTNAGERLLYPYQIRDDRYTASIGYAIAYYERMVGRLRSEFESETLLEFFGDPRLARGLVACLARTYAWRAQTFEEALGPNAAAQLKRANITTPAALRARLYALANQHYGGVILPHERDEALTRLSEEIKQAAKTPSQHLLTPAQIDQALMLDSEDRHVLMQLGPTPKPEEIVALYNYHSLETALCHAEQLVLNLRGPIWNILRSAHNLARRYRLHYTINSAPRNLFDEHLTITITGKRGRQINRMLLRLLASHPDSLVGGEAKVRLRGQTSTLRLDERALRTLGVAAHTSNELSEPWEADLLEQFQRSWSRAFMLGRTAGWRLRRDPEPLVSTGAIVVPDFVLMRGRERLMLCLTTGLATAEALNRDLAALGGRAPAVAVVPSYAAERLRICPAPIATYDTQPSEAIDNLVSLLERKFPRAQAGASQTPWQRLEQRVAEDGFVGQEAVASLLGCPSDEALQLVRRWGGAGLHVLPGLGVCAPEMLGEIRQLIETSNPLQQAA
jgi:predicted nuclease of restriction endonuclease-like RecB superfamily